MSRFYQDCWDCVCPLLAGWGSERQCSLKPWLSFKLSRSYTHHWTGSNIARFGCLFKEEHAFSVLAVERGMVNVAALTPETGRPCKQAWEHGCLCDGFPVVLSLPFYIPSSNISSSDFRTWCHVIFIQTWYHIFSLCLNLCFLFKILFFIGGVL